MSLASPYQEHYYVADGVTTSFSFGEYFTGLSQAYVKCIIYFDDGTNCVPTFTVDMTTGFITIVTLTKPDGTVLTVPPAGSIVRVFRDTPEQQNVTASQLQNYTAKQLERIFDSVVAMIQEVSYSDLHKTIRLTETQRDVSVEQLTEEKNQGMLYWDFESRTLKATDYGQDEVVKSETVDRLLYLQPEGKIYFIPKGSTTPISIGSVSLHNDLSGRNAPDCHPESAITGLREHLQELRDKDIEIEEDVQIALNRSQEAKDTADEAKETAEYAQTVAGQAKDIAEDAKEIAEGIEDIAEEAKDTADEAKEIAQDAKDIAEGVVEDIEAVEEGLANHIADKANPHEVTKAQVGLGNVDNTSDLNKPISTATQAALDLKMPISTKYGASISLTIDSSTYVVTAQLKDQDNNNLGTAQTIDLPLESVVVSGSYDSDTKEVILVLENGSEIRFSVADLISGLQSEITAQNPLDADLVNDSTSAHKFVSATEKTNWNNHIANTNNPHQVTKAQVGLSNVDNTSDLNKPISTATQTALDLKADKSTTYTKTETDTLLGAKQDTISDLATIRSNAQAGKAASDTIATYGNIVTHNVSEFATAAQGAKADTAVQPGDLATVATTGSYNDLSDKPTIPSPSNRVNGAPLSNSASVFYGTSSTAAATVEKEVSIPSITTLDVGTVIVVQPTVTSTVANSTLKLNSFDAYPMRYNNAAITTSTDSIVWNAAYPSVWVFDGTYWRFVAHGIDSNTTYSTMSVAEGTAGTATSNRVLQAANLKQIIQGTTLTGIDVATTGAVSASDTITDGIGKLQATKANTADLATVATSGSYNDLSDKPTIPAAQVNSDWNANSGVAQILNKPTLATVATSGSYNDLSNKPTIPTVNNPTITITQGGVTKGSFSLNQATGDTIALDAGGGGGSADIDNLTITENADQEIQAVAVIDQNTGIAKTWTGTMAEYEAIVTKDPETEYIITDDIGGSATEIGQITEALNDKVDKGHQVVEFQEPTAGNNYTWYRKYADGWVEQGGQTIITQNGNDITLPIEMANTDYAVFSIIMQNTNGYNRCYSRTTTAISMASSGGNNTSSWQVSGMAA